MAPQFGIFGIDVYLRMQELGSRKAQGRKGYWRLFIY